MSQTLFDPRIWIRSEGYRYNAVMLTVSEALDLLDGGLAKLIAEKIEGQEKTIADYKKNVARAKKLGVM